MIVAGIDIGIKGAVAIIDGDWSEVKEMPSWKSGKKTVINQEFLLGILWNLKTPDRRVNVVFIEKTFPRPPMSRVSAWGMGHQQGFIEAALGVMQIPYQLITPQEWKKEFGLLNKTKNDSIIIAEKLFPSVISIGTSLNLTDGAAEALLIAEYGRRKFR